MPQKAVQMRTPDGVEFRVQMWDWRGQPDMHAIDRAMGQVYNGSNRPLLAVAETHSDQYAVVIASSPIDVDAAWQQFVDNDWQDDGGDDG